MDNLKANYVRQLKEHGLSPERPRVILDYIMGGDGRPWAPAEYVLKDHPEIAVDYAIEVLKPNQEWLGKKNAGGRFPEAEANIARHPESAARYACFILQKRWPQAEEVIKTMPGAACDYARTILKAQHENDPRFPGGRWLEAEQGMLDECAAGFCLAAKRYAAQVVGHRWPEYEEVLKSKLKENSTYYFRLLDIILGYCVDVIKGRWPEVEKNLISLTYPEKTFYYAKEILKPYGDKDGELPPAYYVYLSRAYPRIASNHAIQILERRHSNPFVEYRISYDYISCQEYCDHFGISREELRKESLTALTKDFDLDDFIIFPEILVDYCLFVLKDRYYEIEPLLREHSPQDYKMYLKDVIEKPPIWGRRTPTDLDRLLKLRPKQMVNATR